MVLCDPFAINVIGKSIIKILLHLITTEELPRVRFFLGKMPAARVLISDHAEAL